MNFLPSLSFPLAGKQHEMSSNLGVICSGDGGIARGEMGVLMTMTLPFEPRAACLGGPFVSKRINISVFMCSLMKYN